MDSKILVGIFIGIVVVAGVTAFCALNGEAFRPEKNHLPSFNESVSRNQVGNENLEGEISFIGVVQEVNENTILVIPNVGEEIRTSSDKIVVSKVKESDFKVGDKVKVVYNGFIMEMYPAKVDASRLEKIEYTKITKLYLTLIEDIMNKDSNENAKYIAFDLNSFVKLPKTDSGYTALTEEEKTDILNYCQKYHEEIKVASFDDLKAQGFFNEESYSIEGILIYVGSVEQLEENTALLEMTKYRGGLAAIFPEYEAKYEDGIWKIEVKSMAIS